MEPDSQEDLPPQHPSIVYCPSCGASISLPVIPPSNAGLYCDICTSPHLLLSTNDGVDWNPLSDAFNSLSLGVTEHDSGAAQVTANGGQLHTDAHNPDTASHVYLEDNVFPTPIPTMQDEMKRRSLILSELMNFREALYQSHASEEQHGETSMANASTSAAAMNSTTEDEQLSEMGHMQRTFQELLTLRSNSGMFLMDHANPLGVNGVHGIGIETATGYAPGSSSYDYHNGSYSKAIGEEEGMFDDPPVEYVEANPPVREEFSSQPLLHASNGAHPSVHEQNSTKVPGTSHPEAPEVPEDEDDDEGQVYATPEQREEMRARRRELKMDKEAREREMIWRKYNVGTLGVSTGGNG
ncbi:hypothetical protein ABW19_dt0203461 [Dactylella cylindrospora]|nr:hypothetical protein ABW19_dt0203461 [Dactylella cylindrospora]